MVSTRRDWAHSGRSEPRRNALSPPCRAAFSTRGGVPFAGKCSRCSQRRARLARTRDSPGKRPCHMRRVVVTGMGMVSPLACGVEATWSRLLKGESGARRIEKFEVSDLPAKIACQIPRGDGQNGTYNPDQWMEPKEQRKVDEFIIFAMSAATQAIRDAGWAPKTHEEQIATGVMIGSGIGGIEG